MTGSRVPAKIYSAANRVFPEDKSSTVSIRDRYVFAIFFTDVTNEYSRTHSTDDGNVLLLRTYFRDVEQSVLTLFQSITGGLDWGQVADDLHEFSRGWGYLYIFYVAFCCPDLDTNL